MKTGQAMEGTPLHLPIISNGHQDFILEEA